MVASIDPSPSTGRTYPQWITALIANTALLSYGFQVGWVSPMTSLLQSPASPTKPVSDGEMSWIASTLCVSATLVSPLYAQLADTWGRRMAIAAIALCQAISWIIKLTATSSTHLIVARAMCGAAAGGCFTVIPTYVKDISQDNIRGTLGSLLMLFQNLGILGTYTLGALLGYHSLIWAVMWLPWVTLVLIWCAPESPGYLVKKGKIEEATKAIAFLRGLKTDDKVVESEVAKLRYDDAFHKSLPAMTFAAILKDACYRKCWFLIMVVFTVHALSGNFAIMTYATAILSTSGVTLRPELQTLSFPVVMIVGSLLSMSCVERFGRKPLFLITLVVSALSLAALGGTMLYQQQGGLPPGWLPAVSTLVSVFAYGAGVSPLPYIVMAEMLNFQIRCKLMGIVVCYAWFIGFLQLVTFVPISNALGMYSSFFFFAGTNLLGAAAILTFMPETKGKTTEQIEDLFRRKNPACTADG